MAKFKKRFDCCPYCKKDLTGDRIFLLIEDDNRGNFKLRCRECSLTIEEKWSIDITEYEIANKDKKVKEQVVFCKCPDCESKNIRNGKVHQENKSMKRKMRCLDCGILFFEFWDFEYSFIDASKEEIISEII